MVVRIRLFAQLRERAGAELDRRRAARTARRSPTRCASSPQGPPLGELLARLPVRMAVNRELAEREHDAARRRRAGAAAAGQRRRRGRTCASATSRSTPRA